MALVIRMTATVENARTFHPIVCGTGKSHQSLVLRPSSQIYTRACIYDKTNVKNNEAKKTLTNVVTDIDLQFLEWLLYHRYTQHTGHQLTSKKKNGDPSVQVKSTKQNQKSQERDHVLCTTMGNCSIMPTTPSRKKLPCLYNTCLQSYIVRENISRTIP